jgi:hypothetical protein
MHRVEALLVAGLPRLSAEGRKALASLTWDVPPPAGRLAQSVGLKNRFALMRLLREEGLPSYRELAGWIQVLIWQLEWEDHNTALARQAFEAGRYPA